MTVETRRADPADALIETLVAAATTATRNQAAFACDVGRVRGLHLELELSNAGDVIDSTCWVERRGVHRRRG